MYIKIIDPLFDALQASWMPFPRFQTTVHGELEYASRSQTRRRTFLASGSFRLGFQMYIKIIDPLFDALQASWMPFPRFQTTVHGELEYASRSRTRRTTFLASRSFRLGFQIYINIIDPLFDALQASWIPFPRFQTTVHGKLEYAFESHTRKRNFFCLVPITEAFRSNIKL